MSRRVSFRAFLIGGLVVAAVLAGIVSSQASSEPDGLNRVAIDEGFADEEQPHALEDGPTAGYRVSGVDDEGLSTGLAGVIGVVVTFAVAAGLFLLLRRRAPTAEAPPAATA
jgi:hypothetical protein